MAGVVLHTVFLFPMAGRNYPLCMVVAADVADETNVQHTREMERADGYSCCHTNYIEHELGLLGIYDKTARIFLCTYTRRYSWNSLALGILQTARETMDAYGLYCTGGDNMLSINGNICTGQRGADGSTNVAAEASKP